jgi:outer membrane lipoprotein-sorting protein
LISATITTLVKGTMKTMTWLKLKFATGVGVAALLAGGAATVAISETGGGDKLTPQEIAKQSQDAYAALSSYSDSGIVVSTVGGTTLKHAFSIKLARPNLYRIEWEQPTAYFTNKGAVWSAGSGDFLDSNGRLNKRQNSADVAISTAAGISGGSSQTVPSAFLRLKNDLLNSFISSKELKLRNSEKINNVDCHVLTAQNLNNKKGVELTLWIGKADFLIHQRRQVMNPGAVKAMVAETSKSHPELGARLNTELASESVGMVETHENIVLNKKFSPADFAR